MGRDSTHPPTHPPSHPTPKHSLKDEERAKLCVALAYATHSLYYMFLRTKGQPTKNHRVQAELERVKTYMTRLQVRQETPTQPPTHPPTLPPVNPPTHPPSPNHT